MNIPHGVDLDASDEDLHRELVESGAYDDDEADALIGALRAGGEPLE